MSVPSINIDEILVGVRVKFFVWAVTVTVVFDDKQVLRESVIPIWNRPHKAGWLAFLADHGAHKDLGYRFTHWMLPIYELCPHKQRNFSVEFFECQTRLPWPMASESKWFIFRCSTVPLWCIFTSRRCDELSIGNFVSNNYGPSCPQIFDHRFFTSVLESSNASQHAIVSVAK